MLFEFVEYILHRLLHGRLISKYLSNHKRHHLKYLTDKNHNYDSWFKSIFQQTLSLLLIMFVWINNMENFYIYTAFSIFIYNAVHFISHTNIYPKLQDYHRMHHINSSTNFGVSSPIFDWIFGTMHKSYKINWKVFLILFPLISFVSVTKVKNIKVSPEEKNDFV